jgi:hypothetical protein
MTLRCGNPLKFGIDGVGDLCVWAWEHDAVEREFEILGTGIPIEPSQPGKYWDTVITEGGMVWHIFEKGQQ